MEKESGYIRLWRSIRQSNIAKKSHLYQAVWIWILMEAEWREDGDFELVKNEIITIERGSFLTSLARIAKGVSYGEWPEKYVPYRRDIQRILAWLEEEGMIKMVCYTCGRKITVCNWERYQAPK